jgi:hypothetical protein
LLFEAYSNVGKPQVHLLLKPTADHFFLSLTCYCCRLLSPLALHYFLQWLQADSAAPGSTPTWLGWCWAIAVASGGVGMALVHHQFW